MRTYKTEERLRQDRSKLKRQLLLGLFVAILLLLAWTPLGYVPLGILKLTLLHIPVLLGGCLLGLRAGAILGLTFGLTSVSINTLSPGLLSFAFSPLIPVYGQSHGSILALLVALLPRLFLGLWGGLLQGLFTKLRDRQTQLLQRRRLWGVGFAGACMGTVFHTACVFVLLWMCFGSSLAALPLAQQQGTLRYLTAICWINGLPEALVAGLLVPSLYLPLNKRLEALR